MIISFGVLLCHFIAVLVLAEILVDLLVQLIFIRLTEILYLNVQTPWEN